MLPNLLRNLFHSSIIIQPRRLSALKLSYTSLESVLNRDNRRLIQKSYEIHHISFQKSTENLKSSFCKPFNSVNDQYDYFSKFITATVAASVVLFHEKCVKASIEEENDESKDEQSSSKEDNVQTDDISSCNKSTNEDDLENVSEYKSNMFSPTVIEEIKITDPADFNDVDSLTHRHVVQQSAALAVDSTFQLTMRSARAALQAGKHYKNSLIHIFQLLHYHETLALRVKNNSGYEHLLVEVTDAMVAARAECENYRKQFSDMQLLLNVGMQALEATMMCAHISGSDLTAITTSSANISLQIEVEKMKREIYSLENDVKRKESDIIKTEGERNETK